MKKAALLLAVCLFSLTAVASLSARPVVPYDNQSEVITRTLRTSFGPAVEAVTESNPFHLTGDFNGDGMQDLLVLVVIKLKRTELMKDVRVLNPFYQDAGPGYPRDPATKTRRALAIIHGSKSGWSNPLPRGKFLLSGESPILVTFMDRDPPRDGMKVVKRGSKQSRLFPRRARMHGDIIDMATGGAAAFLYWDGRTYQWDEYDAD
jgi:hypothetical protein